MKDQRDGLQLSRIGLGCGHIDEVVKSAGIAAIHTAKAATSRYFLLQIERMLLS
ncbi:hypothetical protein [Paenibacillus kobensis]|uniref:hypothetical protein n=1 Tax=Paenibacillus kobensis TaxID=59841 RepID=UPI0013E3684C|nr:hypothetical protein [Paenibacillus kobensis]